MIFGKDIDKVFSYKTERIVIINEKKLACFYYTLILILFCYLLIYNIILLENHKIKVNGYGNVLYTISGKLIKNSSKSLEIFEPEDYVIEYKRNAFAIITRFFQNSQEIDICGRACKDSSECPEDPPSKIKECVSGKCKEILWCPNPIEKSEEIILSKVEDISIFFSPTIDFPDISTKLFQFSSQSVVYPLQGANTYKISDILRLANVELKDIQNQGAIFDIIYDWNCDYDDETNCIPHLTVKFINQTSFSNPLKTPLSFFHEKIIQKTTKNRDYSINIGFKFRLNSRGVIKKFSFYNLCIQLCIFLIFAGFIKNFVDLVMIYLLPQRDRAIYSKQKIINSADFSDLKEGLDPVKKQREEQIKH